MKKLLKSLAVLSLLALGGWQTFMAGTPSTYIGLVSTRNQVLAVSTPGDLYLNSQAFQYARGASISTGAKIILPCWWSNNGENSSGGPISYGASIEYPIGTIDGTYQFSGSALGTCNDSNLISDAITLTTPVPNGSKYIFRCFEDAHLASSGVLTAYSTVGYAANGDGVNVSAGSQSNLTGSTTTISLATGFSPCLPLATIGSTTAPSVALIGDSRTIGISTTGNASGDNGELAPSIGPYFAYTNLGSAGESCFQASAAPFGGAPAFNLRAVVAPYVTDVISAYGVNDLLTGQSLSTIEQALPACWKLLGAQKAYQITVIPVTSSSDGWTSSTGQGTPTGHTGDANFTIPPPNVWSQTNSFILGSPSGLTAAFDLANAVQPVANDGLWIFSGGPYTGDGIHEFQNAAIIEQNSGVIDHTKIVR